MNSSENKNKSKTKNKNTNVLSQEIQDFYNKALFYAAAAHNNQFYAGDLPYIVHVCMVADEVFSADRIEPFSNIKDAVQIALLHDVLEDTPITKEEMLLHFSPEVARGVDLLTKKDGLPLLEYFKGIKDGGRDVSAIKMCDRIINLQKPPAHWNADKIFEYYEESLVILEMFGWSSDYISSRLKLKIELYEEMFMGK
jgi:Guanosine polyphosphate pyrophosphohydrolases/synthetases